MLLEDMRVVLLQIISKGARNIKDIRDVLDVGSSPRMHALIDGLREESYITKTKKKEGELRNTYKVTKSGELLIKNHTGKIIPHSEVAEHITNYKFKEKKLATPHVKTSVKAMRAVDGISDLIHTNNMLMETIRSIHRKLGNTIDNLEIDDK